MDQSPTAPGLALSECRASCCMASKVVHGAGTRQGAFGGCDGPMTKSPQVLAECAWRLSWAVQKMDAASGHNLYRSCSMTDVQIVKIDEGGVNARILAKETKADFRRIEAASLKMRAKFTSAEGKRFFVRLFNTQQLNAHFISVIARTRLDHEDVARVEATIRSRMDAVTE